MLKISEAVITLLIVVLAISDTMAKVPKDMCFDVPKSAYANTGQNEVYNPAIGGIPAKRPYARPGKQPKLDCLVPYGNVK